MFLTLFYNSVFPREIILNIFVNKTENKFLYARMTPYTSTMNYVSSYRFIYAYVRVLIPYWFFMCRKGVMTYGVRDAILPFPF